MQYYNNNNIIILFYVSATSCSLSLIASMHTVMHALLDYNYNTGNKAYDQNLIFNYCKDMIRVSAILQLATEICKL